MEGLIQKKKKKQERNIHFYGSFIFKSVEPFQELTNSYLAKEEPISSFDRKLAALFSTSLYRGMVITKTTTKITTIQIFF